MYDYKKMRPRLFSESGLALTMAIRDRAFKLIEQAGAARMQEIIADATGDSWMMLAAVDYLVERNELTELTVPNGRAGQHRVFVRGRA